MKFLPSTLRATALAASLACASATVNASKIEASTIQTSSGVTTIQSETTFNNDTEVSAQTPAGGRGAAAAVTSRVEITTSAEGLGTSPMGVGLFQASGVRASGRTDTLYELWDASLSRPLTFIEAEGVTINFTFAVIGVMNVMPISMSSANIGFSSSISSDFTRSYGDSLLVTFGPVAPPPGHLFWNDFVVTGNASLMNATGLTYTLVHEDSPTGRLKLELHSAATNAAEALYDLSLVEIAVTGAYPGQLGLRFDQGDVILLPLSPVPENGAGALMLAGLLMTWVRLSAIKRRERISGLDMRLRGELNRAGRGRMIARLLSKALGGLLLAGSVLTGTSATAATQNFTTTVPGFVPYTLTGDINIWTLTFPQFDPALGTLEKVVITGVHDFTVDALMTAQGGIYLPPFWVDTWSFAALSYFVLEGPGFTNTKVALSDQQGTGNYEFVHSEQVTKTGHVSSDPITVLDSAKEAPKYVGSGTVDLTFAAGVTTEFGGLPPTPGGFTTLSSEIKAAGIAQVYTSTWDLTYVYTAAAVPEPSSGILALCGVGLLSLIAKARRAAHHVEGAA